MEQFPAILRHLTVCFWVEIDGNNTNILKVLDGRPASPASMGIFIGIVWTSKYGGNIWHLFGEPYVMHDVMTLIKVENPRTPRRTSVAVGRSAKPNPKGFQNNPAGSSRLTRTDIQTSKNAYSIYLSHFTPHMSAITPSQTNYALSRPESCDNPD